MDQIVYIVLNVACFVPAIVFHEVAHGFAAYRLGDPTAKRAGRLSLNPVKHIDPFGTVLMPAMLMLANMPVFGYAKPVPYNPMYFKDKRKGDLIVGLAGPFANLVMACLGAVAAFALLPVDGTRLGLSLPYWTPISPWLFAAFALWTTMADEILAAYVSDGALYYLFMFLQMLTLLNLYFMFFNLLPIPPLDGSSIIAFFLPMRLLPKWYRIQRYALPVFMIAVILVPYVLHVNPVGIYLDVTAGNLYNLMYSFL